MTARTRFSMLAVLAVALFGLPALAQAQLFPNATIKRQRVSCLNEDPAYRTYRQYYYGYFPTCWRRFPDGWGCPSRDVSTADVEKALAEIRKSAKEISEATQPELPEGGVPDDDSMQGRPAEGEAPALPDENEHPFEANPRPPGRPGDLDPGAPPARPADEFPQAARRNTRTVDDLTPPGSVTAAPSELDGLVPPADVPTIESTPAGEDETRTSPSVPSAAVPPLGAAPGTPVTVPAGPAATASPNQAPARRTLIGGLIDNLRGRRRR